MIVCMALPLPATQTPPRHDITCTASYSAPRMREAGVEMPKRTRKPSLKVRENLQFQEEKECKRLSLSYYCPRKAIASYRYQSLRSSYSKVQAKKNNKSKLLNQRGVLSSLKTSSSFMLSSSIIKRTPTLSVCNWANVS